MEFLGDIGGFALKVFMIAAAFGMLLILLFSLLRRGREPDLGHISITYLNDHYHAMSRALKHAVLDRKAWKRETKLEKQRQKEHVPAAKRVFLIEFHGDIVASGLTELREQISAILPVAEKSDEVVVRLESNGGVFEDYGLCASQLARVRAKGIPLTVCVDKAAASGGYLMACLGDKILAAPFAAVGSIGVMARVPNFHRLLRKYDIDYVEMTAGEFKRTLSMLGEITDKGKHKFQEDLEAAHGLFKQYVGEYRPQLQIDAIATGEYWHGRKACELNLVDEIITSDDYLLGLSEEADLYRVDYVAPKSVKEKVAGMFSHTADQLIFRWWNRLERRGNLLTR